MYDPALLAAGALLLYLGAEWFVGGAASLALSLRIPKLVVGLTVVAYGTSAPELVVGMGAAHTGHGEIALANVLGSNIANLGLILGLTVLIRPTRIDGSLKKRELPALALSALVLPFILYDGVVSKLEGALLVLAACVYTAWMLRASRGAAAQATAAESLDEKAHDAALAGAPESRTRGRRVLIMLGGLLLLLLGGKLFVEAATDLAIAWGMSERVVGLTIVAVGTSLPELAASLIAAFRGHGDLAVGNVVGSNIFNVLLCLGASATFGSVAAPVASVTADLVVVGVMTLLGIAFMRTERDMPRWEGGLLLLLYVAFLTWLAAG